jgi:hypothetical protein
VTDLTISFESPFVMSSGRLSLRTAGIHSATLLQEEFTSDQQEIIQSDDDEEVIKSDDEEGI